MFDTVLWQLVCVWFRFVTLLNEAPEPATRPKYADAIDARMHKTSGGVVSGSSPDDRLEP